MVRSGALRRRASNATVPSRANLLPGRPVTRLTPATDLITSEQLFNDIGLPPLDIETDRIMMCGSPGMLEELRQTFEARGFLEGSHSEPGHFVIEKAFVER